MTTVAAAKVQGTASPASTSLAAGKATQAAAQVRTASARTSSNTTASAKIGAAATVDLTARARAQLAGLVSGSRPSATEAAGSGDVKSFDEIVQDRSKALADKLSAAFAEKGIPLDEPIELKLDGLGNVTTDSPYKTKIEKMFKDDPELAKEFKDVASLNAMKAAQKALEAFEAEKRAARDDDERSAAYGRYTSRLMRSQELAGTMTLDDGKLRSASLDYMTKAVGEPAPAKASERAKQVAAQRIARPV